MQKKYKRAICGTITSAVIITLVLILAGLEQVSLDEYGLNYNHIMANYSDNNVYGSGLYLIGIANSFYKVNKNQQTISYDNLTTFSTDFYALTAYLEVSYLFTFSTTDFQSLSNFIEIMGDEPRAILQPLIKNQILVILSSKSSSYYQNTAIANTQLETAIGQRVQMVLGTWVGATINVIIESLVCEGTTTNTEIVYREVESLIHDMERVSTQQVTLSGFYEALYSKAQFQVQAVGSAIAAKAATLQRVLRTIQGSGSTLTGKNVTQTMYYNLPLDYDMNLVGVLQELVQLGNRTFPY